MADPIRVLHVDDDGHFADTVATFLEHKHERLVVETAVDAGAALDRLDTSTFDCVVSDYDMPHQTGIEFLEQVRERYSEFPFILFTGKGGEAVAEDAIAAGVTEYLRKGSGTDQYQLLAKRIIDAVERYYAEANYQQIFESVPDGIAIQDPADGSFVDINTRYAALFEYTREELLEAGFEVLHPEEEPYTLEKARQALQNVSQEGAKTFEWPGVTKHGNTRWTEVNLEPTQLNGEARVLAAVRDITDRKERERELERYEAYLEESTDIITILGEEGQIKYQSPSVTRILGYGQDELIGENGFDYLHPEDRDDIWECFADLAAEPGATTTVEGRFRTADDEWRWIQVRATNQLDNDAINGIVTNNRDITERKRQQQELARQNERLEEFARVVAHDLRNPLNVASARVELAQDDPGGDHLSSAVDAIERSQTLIDDLLEIARTDDEVTETEPVDIVDVTECCWEHVVGQDCELYIEAEQTVVANRTRLQQLLENLLGNAVEHNEAAVTVKIGGLEDGFYVADDGCGLPEGAREEVFEPGYSTGEQGTGFGLAIVEEVVEAHDWELDVTSSEAGGARFQIRGVETVSE
jgi:PAS domain S-box-containing protein